MKTTCEECGRKITLDEWDDILVGKECKCGYYVTRYTQEFRESADFLLDDQGLA